MLDQKKQRVGACLGQIAAALTLVCLLLPSISPAATSDGFDFPLADGSSASAFPVTQNWCENGVGLGPHLGVDWGAPSGTVVRAASGGTVVAAGFSQDGYGNRVFIRHSLPNGQTYYSLYGHLRDAPSVGAGQVVGRRQQIGVVGATGYATGPHLHFAITSNGSLPPGYGACGSSGTVNPITFVEQHRSLATHNPKGSYDLAKSPQAGTVRVGGWAFDPDAKTQAVTIHAYVGGGAGTGAEGHNLGKAKGFRADVGRAYPGVGNYHGFDFTFETRRRGSQRVCVYAINIGAGGHSSLGCKSVVIANPDPIGHLDKVGSPSPGTVRVAGWAIDPNAWTEGVVVHAYIGGGASSDNEGHNLGRASSSRPDVGRVYPRAGSNHGFDWVFATERRGEQEVCVYAIDIGPGTNRSLGCKTAVIDSPRAVGQPMDPPSEAPSGAPPRGATSACVKARRKARRLRKMLDRTGGRRRKLRVRAKLRQARKAVRRAC